MTRTRRLFKYCSEKKWAESFLDGCVFFNSLAYFRDYEEAEVRGDRNEGVSVYRPNDGLLITNQTQGTRFAIPNSAFEVTANQEEIFVYCMSRALTDELRNRFKAVACVEVLNPPRFFLRIEKALPEKAARAIGRVEYYSPDEPPNPRWALPDRIALSKFESYSWQQEFRVSFTETNAFDFEGGSHRIVIGNTPEIPKPTNHKTYPLEVGSLRDICKLHTF
jgi:hypothetical protein